jgi:hypothetical protein
MARTRREEQDFGAYRLERAWLAAWRWRLAEHFGGDHGLRLTQAAAKSAARRRLRELRQREAP